jgi:hypothetical protein
VQRLQEVLLPSAVTHLTAVFCHLVLLLLLHVLLLHVLLLHVLLLLVLLLHLVQGGFHGRSIGAMSLTTSKVIYRQHLGPFMPDTYIAPYPYCLHCKVQQEKVRRSAAPSRRCAMLP